MGMLDEERTAPNAPHGVTSTTSSYNDWPNDAGFETFQDETDPVQLKVSGQIPAYAAGVLYRTGPGGHQVKTAKNKTFAVSHWFDGFSQTHRFELLPPSQSGYITHIKYNSRHTCNELVEKIRNTGEMVMTSFGQQQDPCESFFKKVMSCYQTATLGGSKVASDVNVGVTIAVNMPVPAELAKRKKTQSESKDNPSSNINSLWVKTDNATLQNIDPTSLEPLDVIRQPKLHPDLKGPFTGAHSRTDPITGDWYNYNLEVGRQATYRVFSVSATTGETTILATLTGGPIRAAYLHSMLLTERYVILCIFDAYYARGGAKVLWTRNLLDAMAFDPDKKNLWLVVDRHGRGLVGMYESDPFFAFHPVNAWEQASATETGAVDVVADIPTYPNLDVLKRFYYHNMKGTAPGARDFIDGKGDASKASLTRFKLANVGNTTISTTSKPGNVTTLFTAPAHDTPELPTFNPRHATRPHRYIYGVCDRGNSTFLDGLIKYDTLMQTAVARVVHAQSPGEPIFLADPAGEAEDDGVCLSVVLDGTRGTSHLLVLDAKSFAEVGRAEMEGVVPFGFHGTHVAAAS